MASKVLSVSTLAVEGRVRPWPAEDRLRLPLAEGIVMAGTIVAFYLFQVVQIEWRFQTKRAEVFWQRSSFFVEEATLNFKPSNHPYS